MVKLFNGSQVTERPARKLTSGTPGYFTESGENGAPSYPGQDWFNDMIDEFMAVMQGQDLELDPSTPNNLHRALSKIHNETKQVNVHLSQLYIYPEILTADHRLSMSLSGTTLTIDSGQIIQMNGWNRHNTSDYQLRSFEIDTSQSYHVRFNVSDGFYVKNINDLSYNPNGLDESDSAFDTTYNDLNVALIHKGVLMRCVHTNQRITTLTLSGTGSVVVPVCPRIRTIRISRCDHSRASNQQSILIGNVATTHRDYAMIKGTGASSASIDTRTNGDIRLDTNNDGNDKTLSTTTIMVSPRIENAVAQMFQSEIDYNSTAGQEFLLFQTDCTPFDSWKTDGMPINYAALAQTTLTIEYVK